MSPKKTASFRIDDDLLDGLKRIKNAQKISIADQVTRALEHWLMLKGEKVLGPGRTQVSKQLERVRGVGRVTVEETAEDIGQHRYDLAVWQRVHHVQSMTGSSEVGGMKYVEGAIDLPDKHRFVLLGAGLVLHLEDGRTFRFFVRDSNGAIAPRGGIE